MILSYKNVVKIKRTINFQNFLSPFCQKKYGIQVLWFSVLYFFFKKRGEMLIPLFVHILISPEAVYWGKYVSSDAFGHFQDFPLWKFGKLMYSMLFLNYISSKKNARQFSPVSSFTAELIFVSSSSLFTAFLVGWCALKLNLSRKNSLQVNKKLDQSILRQYSEKIW